MTEFEQRYSFGEQEENVEIVSEEHGEELGGERGVEFSVELENSKQNQRGGAGMKARRKRNIEGMLERLKRLQKALKESQKLYYVEQGRVVLRWYQEYKQNRAGVRELEERLKEVAEMFGKSLDESIE